MGEIVVKHGKLRTEIAKAFDVSSVTVRSALKGRTKTELARKIREMALKNGGVELKG